MTKNWVFDLEHYQALNSSREQWLARVLPAMAERLGLRTAVDVGCGLGHFTELLARRGFTTLGLDGRLENTEEAAQRYPHLRFDQANVEDSSFVACGKFDLVLCFGLLYHLENPFRAVRNLFTITRHVLILEGQCLPGRQPAFVLRDEYHGEDQGLRHVAFYPTEPALVKMLYRAGFTAVYTLRDLPTHSHYRANAVSRRIRTVLVASRQALDLPFLQLAAEPETQLDPWTSPWAWLWMPVRRLSNFLGKPWPQKVGAVRRRMGAHE